MYLMRLIFILMLTACGAGGDNNLGNEDSPILSNEDTPVLSNEDTSVSPKEFYYTESADDNFDFLVADSGGNYFGVFSRVNNSNKAMAIELSTAGESGAYLETNENNEILKFQSGNDALLFSNHTDSSVDVALIEDGIVLETQTLTRDNVKSDLPEQMRFNSEINNIAVRRNNFSSSVENNCTKPLLTAENISAALDEFAGIWGELENAVNIFDPKKSFKDVALKVTKEIGVDVVKNAVFTEDENRLNSIVDSVSGCATPGPGQVVSCVSVGAQGLERTVVAADLAIEIFKEGGALSVVEAGFGLDPGDLDFFDCSSNVDSCSDEVLEPLITLSGQFSTEGICFLDTNTDGGIDKFYSFTSNVRAVFNLSECIVELNGIAECASCSSRGSISSSSGKVSLDFKVKGSDAFQLSWTYIGKLFIADFPFADADYYERDRSGGYNCTADAVLMLN